MSNVVKFPYSVSRKAYARKPRNSINGTPEERATLQDISRSDSQSLRKLGRMVAEEIDTQIDNRSRPGSLSTTGKNGRLRKERREVWWEAETIREYWKARLEMESAISRAQSHGLPEGNNHSPHNPDERWTLLANWRSAIAQQLLTPAPDTAAVAWKRAALARNDYVIGRNIEKARVEGAIADDLAFLAAHPVRQSNRRRQS